MLASAVSFAEQPSIVSVTVLASATEAARTILANGAVTVDFDMGQSLSIRPNRSVGHAARCNVSWPPDRPVRSSN